MRWEMLFTDLEAQATAADRADRDLAAADLTRAEAATISLLDRLAAVRGDQVRAALVSGADLAGELREVYPDWVLLRSAGREVVVPVAAVEAWSGLGTRAAPPPGAGARSGGGAAQGRSPGLVDGALVDGGPVDPRLADDRRADAGPPRLRPVGLGRALRGLARDRGTVVMTTRTREHVGRIDRVGRDHLDLRLAQAQDWGERRREEAPVVVLAFSALVTVTTA